MSRMNMLSGKVDTILKNGDKIDELTELVKELLVLEKSNSEKIAKIERIISSGAEAQLLCEIYHKVNDIDEGVGLGRVLFSETDENGKFIGLCNLVLGLKHKYDSSIQPDVAGIKEEEEDDEEGVVCGTENTEQYPSPRCVSEEQPIKKMNIEYNASCEYLNISQLNAKYKNDRRIGRKLRKGELGVLLCGYGLIEKRRGGHGLRATKIGKTASWIIQSGYFSQNVCFRNNDETDKYIIMMINNPRLFSGYVKSLSGENE